MGTIYLRKEQICTAFDHSNILHFPLRDFVLLNTICLLKTAYVRAFERETLLR